MVLTANIDIVADADGDVLSVKSCISCWDTVLCDVVIESFLDNYPYFLYLVITASIVFDVISVVPLWCN